MTNRERVLEAIRTEPLTVFEIAERLDLQTWVVVACIWLEVAKLRPIRDADPTVIRWVVA